jgi:hypothetical protein
LPDPLVGCDNPETAWDAARELSLHYKRTRQWPAAAAIWEELILRDGNDLFALIELAKWCEHQQRDFVRALALVERACTNEPSLSPDDCAKLTHRLNRLQRKLAGRKAAL